MGKKVRIKDIASRLGLSSTLVSMVLNNKGDQHGIKRQTQDKVRMAAEKMGYYKSSSDISRVEIVDSSPGIVGMIVPSLIDPFVTEVSPYLQKALSSLGIGFSVLTKDPSDKRFIKLLPAFKKIFSGLIIVGDSADEATIRAMKNNDYPFIVMESHPVNMRINLVKSSCDVGIDLLVKHILKLGYKRLTLISSNNPSGVTRDNCNIFNNTIASLSPEASLFNVNVNFVQGIGLIDTDTLAEYMRAPYQTDIFVIAESQLVYPVVDYLSRNNIKIPKDVALVSLEDGIGFDLFASPVTRIKKQVAEMASKASKMIWSEIKNSGKSKYKRMVNIVPEVVVGRSCGTLI